MITAPQLRKKWLGFFTSKGYLEIAPAPLVPLKHDNSLLFINAGVTGIKDYFLGHKTPNSEHLVNIQRVIRTNDIENIGKTSTHLTSFEMMGNFSTKSHGKQRYIEESFDFLVNHLHIDPEKLIFTIHHGDQEALQAWTRVLRGSSQIVSLQGTQNFWDLGSGPCGPCTEIFFDRGNEFDPLSQGIDLLISDIPNNRYIEIWNIVFSEQLNTDGNYSHLANKKIDTGMGLERVLMILQQQNSVYETTLFPDLSTLLPDLKKHEICIIKDHLRTVLTLLNEGVNFGAKSREALVRKLMRKVLWILYISNNQSQLFCLLKSCYDTMQKTGHPFSKSHSELLPLLQKESNSYSKIMISINNKFSTLLKKYEKQIPVKELFILLERHGAPWSLLKELHLENSMNFPENELSTLLEQHKQSSISTHIQKVNFAISESKHLTTTMIYHTEHLVSQVIWVDPKIDQNNQRWIALDQTILFPDSAGQESDHGWINGQEVCSSKKHEGIIKHQMQGDFVLGQTVTIRLNQSRNINISRHHTLEHLLTPLMKGLCWEINSSRKKETFLSITVETNSPIEVSTLRELESQVKLQIKNPSTVEQRTLTEGELANFVKLPKIPGKNRYVDVCGSVEWCSGTHLQNTAQIEDIYIFNPNKKGRSLWELKIIAGHDLINQNMEKALQEWRSLTTKPSTHLNLHSLLTEIHTLKIEIQNQDKTDKKELSKQYLSIINEFIKNNSPDAVLEFNHITSLELKTRISLFKKTLSNLKQGMIILIPFVESSGTTLLISKTENLKMLLLDKTKEMNLNLWGSEQLIQIPCTLEEQNKLFIYLRK